MIDGPYYLIQVRSLLTTGGLVYGDPPLTFYLLSVTSALLGDISLGVKVGVSLLSAQSTVPAYFLMKRVAKTRVAGILTMLFIIFSPLYIRTLTDFMKNAIGICWLLAFMYYLHDIAVSGVKKQNMTLATFFLLLTGMTHILDFGVALLFMTFYTLGVLVFGENKRPFLKSIAVLFLAVCVFIVVASVFFGSLFTDFTKAATFINEIFNFQVNAASPTLTQPARIGLRPKPVTNMGTFSLSIAGGWPIIGLILALGAGSTIYAWRKNDKQTMTILLAVTFIGVITSFPFLPGELLGRFLLMMVVPTAVIVSYAISKVWKLETRNLKWLAVILVAVSIIGFVGQSFRTIEAIKPSINSTQYVDLVNFQDHITSDSVVVAPQGAGLSYWIEYIENTDVFGIPELSPELWQSYSDVFGIVPKNQIPVVPHQIVDVGQIYVLVEFEPPPNRGT
jgi:hypothetical protein